LKHLKIAYQTTPEIRDQLKTPFGKLLRGTYTETAKKLKAIVRDSKPPKIVTVGDKVSKNLYRQGIIPHLVVTDNRSMRRRIRPTKYTVDRVLHVENPPGTITEEAITAMRESLLVSERVQILVDGEEDLLTIISVLYAPEKSMIAYGQPHEGLVLVEVTANKKIEASKILEAMAVRKPK